MQRTFKRSGQQRVRHVPNAQEGRWRVLLTWLLIPISIFLLAWFGVRVKPTAFLSYPQTTGALTTLPLVASLPKPVEQFYRKVYGDHIPAITTAVLSGRASMRIKGITLPARFRFTHEAGQNYRHYIEATFFGQPILRVNESYLNGNSRLELPFGVTEGEATVNQAANLGLWSETIWFPSVFLTDARVQWEAIDGSTARLLVPFEDAFDEFTVRFDAETQLIRSFESMRYKGAESPEKTLWRNDVLEWAEFNGTLLPARASATWADETGPWAIFTLEEVVYNADVKAYVRAKGL